MECKYSACISRLNMKFPALLILMALPLSLSAQDMEAYRVYTTTGKKSDFKDIVRESVKADVVFFGELHDNPVAHWLELEITKALFAEKGKDLILAAEMFERDNQLVIDEYFSDLI